MVLINTEVPRRVVLQRQLALALRNIEAGVQRIAKQHEVIAKLDAGGHDASAALTNLATFEREHELNIANHRQIMRELTALGQVSRLRQHRARRVRLRARKQYATRHSSS
jgi:hypothetical protein